MRRFVAGLAATLLAIGGLGGTASADPSEYGIESASATASTNQAGAHPDFTVAFKLKREPDGKLPSTTRDVSIELPPGLLANPNAVPKCSAAQLTTTDVEDPSNETGCPQASQVGITEIEVFFGGGVRTLFEPVYNMESPGGDVVARLGFIAELFPVFINAHLRSDGDYGATVKAEGASSVASLISAATTTWGVPAAESHDAQRITPYEATHNNGAPDTPSGKRPSGLVPAPFMLNPTRCGVAREIKITATSYGLPDQPSEKTVSLPPVSGCGALDFDPSLTLTSTSREAAMPTGLDSELTVPQNEAPNDFSTSQLRYAKVELPEGMTIASGAGDGLEACSAEEVGYEQFVTSHCPDASKIGTAEIDSPALSEILDGAVYQRTPIQGDLFGIWLVTDELGVHLKLPGEVEVDPQTGQIVANFEGVPQAEGIPQAPVRAFRLNFFSGSRAPLANPPSCGTYFAHYEFTPWSGGVTVKADAPMTIDQGCDTGGFDPKLSAWPESPIAGAFSPLITKITRESKEQNISGLQVTLPSGVSAKLAGVALCDGQAAETGNCPPASEVGRAVVAAGPGPSPLWLPQPGKDPIVAYLAGPYESAPYSLVVKAPAQVGPFDLGTVVTRAAIGIDPETAQATVTSDPLAQILEGVPITYRTIHVDVDRPNFALNPTSCKEMAAAATLTSPAGATAYPSSRFQVGGCAELGFKPKLSIRLFGKTNRGAHPRLRAVLRTRKGDANSKKAQVALPRSEFLDQGHIRTVCTRVQFAADQCPKGSIYGYATATTPLLDQPLKGPVYLRSSNNLLPDLVIALKGKVEINAVGRIDSIKGGIRTTFETVPDAPITKFVLTMQGGKKGLLVNSRNLCKATSRAAVEFDAHNGKSSDQHPILQNDCASKARKPSRKP
jgi:hypothetical protein